jgi:hypothetical protein
MSATREAVTHIRESWRFKSMYTLQRKTWYTCHIRFPRQSTYATRTLLVSSPRTWQPFTLTQQSWTDPTAPEKKDSRHNPQHIGWPIRMSATQFLSQHNYWSSRLKPSICWWTSYIGLLCPYHQHVISMFNTCSRGPTYWSLTDTGEGYNLGSAGFPHHTPRPSQLMVLRFPLMASPGLRLIISI